MNQKQQPELSKLAINLQEVILYHLHSSLGKTFPQCTHRELCLAISLAVRSRLLDQMLATEARYQRTSAKRLHYLSMEFLIGRSLSNNLSNLQLTDACQEALASMGLDLQCLLDEEEDAALGNGGLGRLAACLLDSLATLQIPGYGYGINYEYGLFKQVIEDGHQHELPDYWNAYGSPWLLKRPDDAHLIPLYGRLEEGRGPRQSHASRWVDWQSVIGLPHDLPIAGYGGRTVHALRLYSARSADEFDIHVFHQGDYVKAVEQKITSERISKILYPSDSIKAGRELRLIQEYFLVSCAISDIIARYLKQHRDFDAFPAKVAIQLNDTHPVLAVAELMRRLIDEYDLDWKRALEITQATLAYTNHTLLPEALEKWPVPLFELVLPRHLQIIYEINHHFLQQVTAIWPGEPERMRRMSIVEEGYPKQIRMAHLAVIGTHAVNGVSALHSRLLQTSLLADFADLWPERFYNVTNGITQRRWLLQANPRLASLISTTIGADWITNLDALRALEPYAQDAAFQRQFLDIKQANKQTLAHLIEQETGVCVAPLSLFDIQVKRIHEYKRQVLNLLHIMHLYLCLVDDHNPPSVPHTFIFAGKAAPEYWAAKQIIKMIHHVAQVVNGDPRVGEQLKVVFLPDYRVSLAEMIIPAADLSEQISTAGTEASGTSNMKFALNGALTVGTLDGANIEIREEVGADNIFIFGLTADEIGAAAPHTVPCPRAIYNRSPVVRRVVDAVRANRFCPTEPGLFDWLHNTILANHDRYYHLADLESYVKMQARASHAYSNRTEWARKAILNVARIGKFSSDRTVREYARHIWHMPSVEAP